MKTMLKNNIEEMAKKLRPGMINTLRDLIAIPTSNPPGQAYQQCADYLSGILEKWGIDFRVITGPQAEFPRFFILGEWGEGETSLHFHGHYDVVPADFEEQFRPSIRGNRVYGRGSADMKSGLIVLLFALRIIQECGIKQRGKISFSLVPDEETGGHLGTRYLLEKGLLQAGGLGMLMPEPTSGVVWTASKGALTYRIAIKGKSAHVALEHQGENAFKHMVDMAHSFFSLREKVRKRKTHIPVSPSDGSRSAFLIGGQTGSGVNFNVVPEKAFFTIDRRINPEESLAEAKKEIEDVLDVYKKKGVLYKTELLQEGEPSFADPESRLALALKRSIRDVTEHTPAFELCPGLCEIRFFNKLGIPAYAYGPGLLEVAHGPDEYVDIERILACTVIYALTALRLMA
jgi:acetylornithine deacetylase/succinyl-diaminopimelate desuccinylase family protein